jgi:hypothetical protein
VAEDDDARVSVRLSADAHRRAWRFRAMRSGIINAYIAAPHTQTAPIQVVFVEA